MITPRFSCSQSDISVVASIYCPSVRASEVEIHVEESLLSVHIAPYFLRLNFPYNVVEDDVSSAIYDPASGYLTITLTKEVPGQYFPDLDLLAKLLAPRSSKNGVTRGPVIEVLSSMERSESETSREENPTDTECATKLSLNSELLTAEQREILEAARNDWQVSQKAPESMHELRTGLSKPYGFFSAYTGYFHHVASTENEINELGPDAEILPPEERRRRRLDREDAKWDEEHYMADYADHDMIEELRRWVHPHLSTRDVPTFTEDENLIMLRLPRKEYLVTPQQTRATYLTLVTVLFAYAYDARSTQHEPTPESAWTICALIPAFSALDPPPYSLPLDPPLYFESSLPSSTEHFFDRQEVVCTIATSYRRSLVYPLYRSWALSEACRFDVAGFLVRGRRMVLRCLLEIRALLDSHETYYVYSRVWLDDFCRWTQSDANEDMLRALGKAVQDTRMEKCMTGWNLEELETAVDAAAERSVDSDDESESEVE